MNLIEALGESRVDHAALLHYEHGKYALVQMNDASGENGEATHSLTFGDYRIGAGYVSTARVETPSLFVLFQYLQEMGIAESFAWEPQVSDHERAYEESKRASLLQIAEAVPHLEKLVELSEDDLGDGDGYETLEYLKSMRTWISAVQHALEQLGVQVQKEEA